MLYDTIIIGASAAGMSAAIYAARRGLHFIVISQDIGGEMIRSGEIGNYPGVKDTDGIALTETFQSQMEEYGVEIQSGVARSVQKNGKEAVVSVDTGSDQREYRAKSVIVATGIHPRELNVPGERVLRGKGVTYCTVCDGPLYKGKVTATIGGGNSALESALMMSGIAKEVYLLNIYDKFYKGDAVLIKKVEASPNVHIIREAKTLAIQGEHAVKGLSYQDMKSGEEKRIDVEGVMVHIGMIPNSHLAQIEKNKLGEIMVDKGGRTSVEGIFAAGDVVDVPYKQLAIAAGSGVSAALSMVDFVNRYEHA